MTTVFTSDKLPTRLIFRLKQKKRNTFKRNAIYWFQTCFDNSIWYRKKHNPSKIVVNHSHAKPSEIKKRIKIRQRLDRIQAFMSCESKRPRKGHRVKSRRLEKAEGQTNINILEDECEEVLLKRQTVYPFRMEDLFTKFWRKTWEPTSRYLIRWRDGCDIRFFQSDSIEMLGRMYTASQRRKQIHLLHYIDFNRLNMDMYRETVEKCAIDVEEFLEFYASKRKENRNLEQRGARELCRTAYCCNDSKSREVRSREKNSVKAHRKESLNRMLQGIDV